jgi:hypothetical protein
MFRAFMCPSSGETTVFMRHLVLAILYGWLSVCRSICSCIQTDIYLFFSTCFGQICAHHQEKQLYLCDTWYLLFCMDDCLVCRSICSVIPDSYLFIIFCMFRANMCPSSGETTVFMRHLVLVILYGWLSGMQEHMLFHTRQSFLFSTCFGRLYAHHQEKQLYLCYTWYLSLCMDDCLTDWQVPSVA